MLHHTRAMDDVADQHVQAKEAMTELQGLFLGEYKDFLILKKKSSTIKEQEVMKAAHSTHHTGGWRQAKAAHGTGESYMLFPPP
ncbi:hypothetical protein C2845_PM01G21330 [Panicum miliaceum]|uniref:Uncharacterized protein n=1 Tax=Panicum miliaceum TaxID=4540 RepID=A0A3L6TIH1_PANMI|nr:hypothetical protein C2845_PM01G21330 [Panicum miliaceum]